MGDASQVRGMHCSHSKPAYQTPANSHHGKERIAVSGRVFTAATQPTMLSSSISMVKIFTAARSSHSSYTLGGEMSSSLVRLQHLRYLDLSYNNFSSASIPKFIGSFKSLEYLNLSYAVFGGRMPPQLGNLSKLVYLDINSNCWGSPYTDSLTWVSRLSSLKYLDMSWTNLSLAADWIHAVSSLPSLEVLHLAGCDLRNTIANLGHYNLTALKVLGINDNSFHTAIAPNWFWHMTKLTYLDLSSCDFQGQIPYDMGNMTSLEQVYIRNNNITSDLMERLGGNLPNWLLPLKNLSYLNLFGNDITGPLPIWIGSLNNLTVLNLGSNNLVGEIYEGHLEEGLTNLQMAKEYQTINALDISNATIDDNTPDWLWSVVSKADYLDMSNNLLTGTLPTNLETLAASCIDLSSNRFTGPIPRFPRYMRYLDLSRNNLSGTLPDFVAQSLESVALYNNSISGSIPYSLSLVEPLHILDLSGNMLSGEISRPKELVYLDLAYNQFSGNLPAWLQDKLPSLAFLRLRSNKFSGNIPVQLAKIQSLRYIDLACNSISGHISESLMNLNAMTHSYGPFGGFYEYGTAYGDAYALESLDLSHNELSGEIPSSISALTSLTTLNLSYNNLSGRIPTGNQLQTLALDDPASMYIGNTDLCGPSLPKACPGNGTSNSPADEHELQDNGMVDSIYLSMIVGFIFGHWVVLCIMMLHKRLRYSYFFFIDGMYHKVCMHMIVITWNLLMMRR
ncbi:unnamed protein product [Urochloa decumbens]|uniref:Disease resistance R13L4/SHOC-2-like LRR domain-containing protein n=1 Tax=Urochloa decumbens TaxID=240449 RepID=A0ABC9B6Q2_9POAL